MSINRVVVSGNLTRDPEIRSSQSGTNILTFGMAVNDRRRNPQTQEWEDYANFVDCVLFGNRADYMSRALRKGTKVIVEGKLRYSSWERDGQRRSKLEVVVDDIDFMSPRQQQQGGYAPQQGGYVSQQPSPYAAGQQQQGYAPSQSQQGYAQGPTYSAPAPMPQPQMSAPQSPNQGYAMPNTQPAPQPTAQPAPAPASSSPAPVTAQPETDVYDDDIPF